MWPCHTQKGSTWLDGRFLACRDGLMRGQLEAHMIYAMPSELLVAQPVSGPTQRLLGTFSQAVKGLKAETVQGGRLTTDEAAAELMAFYASGKHLSAFGINFSFRREQ